MGLLQKMFGNKKQKTGGKSYQLLGSSHNSFSKWNGDAWQNDIVRACIRPKYKAIGKIDLKQIEGFGSEIKIGTKRYISELLMNPNEYMTMQELLEKLVIQRELHNNAFAVAKYTTEGTIEGLYPVPYSSVDLLDFDNELYVKFWFVTRQWMIVPYKDCIHLRKDYNENDIFGDSNSKALKNIMEVVETTDQGIVNAIKNSAVIRWLLKFNNVLREDDKKLIIDEFVKNYLSISNKTSAAATDPRYDAKQIEPKEYIPNAKMTDRTVQRLQSYYGVNDGIVKNMFDEDKWNAFYEAELEPVIKSICTKLTNLFFTKREKAFGNKIVASSSSLQFASMSNKLGLVAMVDRGALTPNEWREVLNLGPIEGGDKPLRRLDTVQVNDDDKGGNDSEDGQNQGKDWPGDGI